MPGPALHVSATISCPHGASVSAVSSNTRVKVSGMAVTTVSDTFTISGCPFQVPAGPSTKPQPCLRVQWTVPATRVTVVGQPVLLSTSSGLCLTAESIPQGAPLVTNTQTRVTAT